jgi:hypothetical protein
MSACHGRHRHRTRCEACQNESRVNSGAVAKSRTGVEIEDVRAEARKRINEINRRDIERGDV